MILGSWQFGITEREFFVVDGSVIAEQIDQLLLTSTKPAQ